MRPLNIDKEAVRLLVISVGPREAAKRTGIKESTVLQWSARGKWLAPFKVAPKLPESMTPRDVINVIPASQALVDSLQSMGKSTRISLAKAAKTGADHASKMTGKDVLANARAIGDITKVASTVHGWTETQASVHISCMGGEQPADALEIDVEVQQMPSEEDSDDDILLIADSDQTDPLDLDSY